MGTKAGSRWVPASGQRTAAGDELDGPMRTVKLVRGGELLKLVRLIKLILEWGPAAGGPRYTPRSMGTYHRRHHPWRRDHGAWHTDACCGDRLDRTEDR